MQTLSLTHSPDEDLRQRAPDQPVLYLSPAQLQATARRFIAGFPGLVTYAVKANPHQTVLDNLVAAGLGAFDVASPAEMTAVRAAAPLAVLHYNNPVRSRSEVAEGIAAGVSSWSVDASEELAKLSDAPQTEVAVRFKLPVSGAAYDFGEKFGATPGQAVALLKEAVQMGFAPALCFHPGTQCTDPAAWTRYVAAAAEIARQAGVTLRRLNVGGGFPSNRGADIPPLETFFDAIRAGLVAFETAPQLVCEPGRAMVAEAATLAVRIKARRGDTLYLNDGIYGAMTELRDMGPTSRIRVVSHKPRKGPATHFRAFGPTCDSLDKIPDGLTLPADMGEDDYILIDGMGAYSLALTTPFNGYGAIQLRTVTTLSGQSG